MDHIVNLANGKVRLDCRNVVSVWLACSKFYLFWAAALPAAALYGVYTGVDAEGVWIIVIGFILAPLVFGVKVRIIEKGGKPITAEQTNIFRARALRDEIKSKMTP